MTTEYTIELFCDRCRKSQGMIDLDEYQIFSGEEGVINLCFDCDPDSASTVPWLFWWWQEGDVFVIGDEDFLVAERPDSESNMLWLTHARGHARALSGLSSSTYVHKSGIITNRNAENDGVTWGCPYCEDGVLWPEPDAKKCYACGYFEPIPQEIIISAWIVSSYKQGARENLRGECPDCFESKQNGGDFGLCGYHKSLWDEIFEDNRLGGGYEK